MKYTPQEVIQFIQEEDVKFIRLAFCDVLGRHKNISIIARIAKDFHNILEKTQIR